MATAEQIKSLIRSHLDGDKERFATIAMQLAAHEARMGHAGIANDIRVLVDKAKFGPKKASPFNKELNELVLESAPAESLSELILPDEMRERIERIVDEFRQKAKLKKFGLSNRRKILLAGPPGTGKTMTASVLAHELHLPFATILMDRLVTKFMGETSAKLRSIFEIIQSRQGVYLFDEFDAIGTERSRDNDVGEIRRVLNSFLQFLELDDSDSLVIAATNTPGMLDQALFRRFDDVLYYRLPTKDETGTLIRNRLGQFSNKNMSIETITQEAMRLSHAEITQACNDAIKQTILSDKQCVSPELLLMMLRERQAAYSANKG